MTMYVEIRITGPQGCGKTILGEAIRKTIEDTAPPGTVVSYYAAQTGGPLMREYKFLTEKQGV